MTVMKLVILFSECYVKYETNKNLSITAGILGVGGKGKAGQCLGMGKRKLHNNAFF